MAVRVDVPERERNILLGHEIFINVLEGFGIYPSLHP